MKKPTGGNWGDIDQEPDRESTNNSDGQTFYGFDDEETGDTDWYNEDGGLDSVTPTPSDD